jgi:DMSO/TMAO reductase YedYZ heme-binding membrane subunit/nitrite reductase/ring-hydroxylating ferredoxin subunit
MSHAYRRVQWNHHKRIYDAVLLGAIVAYLAGFIAVTAILNPAPHDIAPPILLMRAFGTAAAVLLHLILAIGPLTRLMPPMAPVLYNRRHLGVACFTLAGLHAVIALGFYGGFGVVNPVAAVLAGPGIRPPFEIYGFAALVILLVMAATSHDFWLTTLGPGVWKSLHMLVYPAYALLTAHIAFGAMQSERSVVYPVLLFAGIAGLTALHLLTGLRERARDAQAPEGTDWIDLGLAADMRAIPDQRARTICLRDAERIAVFRDGDRLHAVADACPHQGGPLGEGRLVNGCITCPWHGHQFAPDTGRAPAPYTDIVPTHELRIRGDRVELNPVPNPPGAVPAPVRLPEGPAHA